MFHTTDINCFLLYWGKVGGSRPKETRAKREQTLSEAIASPGHIGEDGNMEKGKEKGEGRREKTLETEKKYN